MTEQREFISSSDELRGYFVRRGINPESVGAIHLSTFSFLATPYYLDLIDWTDPSDPLRRMIWPDAREKEVQPYEHADPIGDRTHEPVPGIVHRYSDRCLLMLTPACSVHCRFCFRRNLLGSHRVDAEQALDYIRSSPEIREVIFSGGDPFMLPEQTLAEVLQTLSGMNHVRTIRFHTRVPVVNPARVSDAMLDAISGPNSRVIVLHINHPREITAEFRRAVDRLRALPAIILSQSVLLRGVNDHVSVLEQLFLGLIESGVIPYYLHHLDPAAGTHHFRLSLDEGRALYADVLRRLPSYTVPEYVVDIPSGPGKVPVMNAPIML